MLKIMTKTQKPNLNIKSKTKSEQPEINENTEKIYKLSLKIMTWIAGICFLLIIIFHLFNNTTLDVISKFLYYFIVIILLSFTIIEFKADKVKQKIQKYIKVSS